MKKIFKLLKLCKLQLSEDLNYLQSVILKLNRVDFWSGAHPNQMPKHMVRALTHCQTYSHT